jgi:hypothetical protein
LVLPSAVITLKIIDYFESRSIFAIQTLILCLITIFRLAKYLRASFRRSVRRVQNIWQHPRRGSVSSQRSRAGSVAGVITLPEDGATCTSIIHERSLENLESSYCSSSGPFSAVLGEGASATSNGARSGEAPPPPYSSAVALVESLASRISGHSAGSGVSNPSFISDDPSGNDVISEVPCESHYTIRAAEVISARRPSLSKFLFGSRSSFPLHVMYP